MKPRATLLAVLLISLAGAAAPSGAAPGALPPETGRRIVHEGVAVDFSVEALDPGTAGVLREGTSARFRFAVADTTTELPLGALTPAAWMHPLPAGEGIDPERCTAEVKEFLSGSILSQAELDLNVYYVLALNHDATISVVDPLFGFGGTKLLAMVRLPSPGEDWALAADRGRLFVSLPDSKQVAVVDTVTWEVEKLLDVGPRPTEVVMQADGAYLWVALDDPEGQVSGVAAVDTRRLRVAAVIPTGPGPHQLAVGAGDRFVFASNRAAGTVSVIDVAALAKVRDVATGRRPVAIDYTPLADALWVSHAGGDLVAVDGSRHQVTARLEVAPGLGDIRFAPDRPLGFVVNPENDELHVIDAAAQRIIQTGEMNRGPDQLSFTPQLAYVRHRDSEIVLMIPLDEVGREGKPVPVVDFPGGEQPFGRGVRGSSAASIVEAPEATAVLVANPADEVIYYYKEGMAAPMGSFQNYGRQPRGVLVVDRSLGERTRPGTYETVARLPRPGRYEVAFFLDTPRIVHCFEVEVAADPELEAARRAAEPVRVEPLTRRREVVAGEPVRLRFRLTDPRTGEARDGLRDVRAMAYSTASWQHRQPARGIGDGVYEADFLLPAAGTYFVQLECPSQRLRFDRSPKVVLSATAPGESGGGR